MSSPGSKQYGDRAPRRKPFLQQSYGDMVRSLVLFVVVIGLVYGCNRVFADDTTPPADTVDYASRLDSAEQLADYDVLAPTALPDGWRATSVDLEQSGDVVSWHLGFLDPDDHYVGLEQTNGDLDPATAERVGEAPTGQTVEVAGRRWQVRRDAGGDNALVNVEGGVTTVVIGTPDIDVLRRFAASLR